VSGFVGDVTLGRSLTEGAAEVLGSVAVGDGVGGGVEPG